MKIGKVLGLVLLVSACQPKALRLTQTTTSTTQMNSTVVTPDADMERLIAPYRVIISQDMNRVIGYTDTPLEKGQPECTLGSFVSDAMQRKAIQLSGEKVDFSVCNIGGLRIPSIPKGEITAGKIFELMPFDNLLVILTMDGKTLREFLNHTAKLGGWPVSSEVRFHIAADGTAENIMINDEPLDDNRIYKVGTSDYLANGSDNCTMLKKLQPRYLNKLLRDALMEFVKEETALGRHLRFNPESRVTK